MFQVPASVRGRRRLRLEQRSGEVTRYPACVFLSHARRRNGGRYLRLPVSKGTSRRGVSDREDSVPSAGASSPTRRRLKSLLGSLSGPRKRTVCRTSLGVADTVW